MVTVEQVWSAFEAIPDPEIPVISLVDLGVIRDVGVENGSVRVWFTPTFLGCPALEVMRDAIRDVEDGADEFDLMYRRVDGYSIKARQKEARERAGTAGPG